MIVVPAIDIRGGKCVRLLHGDPNRETRYEGDPVERARAFVAAGAARLHVVDLDGAFGTGENVGALRAICGAVPVPIQTGGGIRTREDVMARFEAGARFVIVGTMLIEDPALAKTHQGVQSFYWGGAFGTWFWIDPVNEMIVIGMIQNMGGTTPDGAPLMRELSAEAVYAAMTDRKPG